MFLLHIRLLGQTVSKVLICSLIMLILNKDYPGLSPEEFHLQRDYVLIPNPAFHFSTKIYVHSTTHHLF